MKPTVLRRMLLPAGDGNAPRRRDLLLGELDGRPAVLRIADRIEPPADADVIDGKGVLLLPAFTDIGAILSDPNRPLRETPATAAAAALAGGYRRIAACPDEKGRPADPARYPAPLSVYPLLPLTEPETIAAARPALWFDGGGAPSDSGRLRAILSACRESGGRYVSSARDRSLFGQGAVAAGRAEKWTGAPGIPVSAESAAVARELILAAETGCPIHFLALSSAESIGMIRLAKARGVPVTCGVSPFHLAMTEQDVVYYGASAKLNPPLRTGADRDALREAALDGTVDCLTSLHTPLTGAERALPIASAPFGASSLDTAPSVLLTYLPELLRDKPDRLASLLSIRPAELLGLDVRIREGGPADLVGIDPRAEVFVSANTLQSRGVGTPFLGQTLRGRVTLRIFDGVRI